MDWFLYDNSLRHERVKATTSAWIEYKLYCKNIKKYREKTTQNKPKLTKKTKLTIKCYVEKELLRMFSRYYDYYYC